MSTVGGSCIGLHAEMAGRHSGMIMGNPAIEVAPASSSTNELGGSGELTVRLNVSKVDCGAHDISI